MRLDFPDLVSSSDWSCNEGNLLQAIRSTTQIRVVTDHQYGISVLVSQTIFRGETSGGVAKCWLFCQPILSAVKKKKLNQFLTKRFIRAIVRKNKHKKRKKYPKGGNGFNGLLFASLLWRMVLMKVDPKSSSPIIITSARSRE